MAQYVHGTHDLDRALVHHFIRREGRAPTKEEVDRLQSTHAWIPVGVAARVRRRAARLILRG